MQTERLRSFLADPIHEELSESPHVVQRDHGNPIAHQGIVRIVPLRTLGVHPYPGFWDEIVELGQPGNEQFFHQAALEQLPIGRIHQTLIIAQLSHPVLDVFMQLIVEPNGVLRIGHDIVERTDAVRHIGKHQGFVVRPFDQIQLPVCLCDLQQFEQIDDLVISPITDVGP